MEIIIRKYGRFDYQWIVRRTNIGASVCMHGACLTLRGAKRKAEKAAKEWKEESNKIVYSKTV